MPITTRFVGGMLEIHFEGEIEGSHLFEHLREVRDLEERESVAPSRLVDLRDAFTKDVRFGEVNDLAANRRTGRLKNPIKSAFLAVTPLQFGLARTFQTLNDNPQITVRIFRDEAQARAWLAE